jgi:hypothetical protein
MKFKTISHFIKGTIFFKFSSMETIMMVLWEIRIFGKFIQNGLKMTRSNELGGVAHHLFDNEKGGYLRWV